MSGLPKSLRAKIKETLGVEPGAVAMLGGGMINRAARVETSHGPIFVKWKESALPGFFAVEAHGLSRLRATEAMRVPEVIAFQDRPLSDYSPQPEDGVIPFLAMEFIESHAPADPARFARRFGAELATLHRTAHSSEGEFGLEIDNLVGELPQINRWKPSWTKFYRDCRLLPQIEIARRLNRLPDYRERLLLALLERLDHLLRDLSAQPVLLHGDLWSGNFLSAGDEPVVVDPAVYYGEREIEIAYIELFGGFPAGFLTAYREAFPLDPGYERRRLLHQLYPLLNHLNHFGETYGPQVDAACRFYTGDKV